MTEVEQPPQNGIDLSTEDDDNNKARPADIEQDMREMERRKRVEAIMGSKLFREELERIVDTARDGGASGILQQLSDMVGLPTPRISNVFKSSNCLQPINDIRGVESMGYAKGEKILRCKLAATFRLLDLYGWTQGLGAQITARLKVDQEVFLVNPYGLLYHEITASSLNKVDMQGQVVEQGTTNFGVNKNHFVLHSIVHAARPDIRCAIYIGCSPVVAVSSLKTGLLPLTKDSCVLGDITTHPYTGSLLEAEERDKLVRNLGPISKVMLLNNHGALCCGETIEEAFFAACHIVQACETQLKLLPVGLDNLVLIPEESRKTIYEHARRPPEDLEKKFAAALATVENNKAAAAAAADGGEDVKDGAAVKVGSASPKWRVGGAEFEALMRMLDNAGYRTGYIYRHPLVKSELPKPKNDVELPPAVSSLGYLLEEEELYRQGIWKKGDLRKGGDRSRWLNSPNVYQKVEVLETGTPDPKKITKWVAEGSPTHSTPVRIEDAMQFVPAGTNPREFKRVQQQIKDNRRADLISAGPQSHILEGVTWDEANRIKDATVSSAGDHVVLMGAASKGIIQRGFQHNATVYKAPYAKNPFDNVTDDELNEYKRTVERKKKSIHGEYTDTDFSESEALSSLHASAGAQLMKHTAAAAAVSQSEPEDASEHQVMRIQTQQAPVPSQPEVVLSDATLDFINGERSHTATNKKPPTGRDTEEICQVEISQKTQIQDPLHINDEGAADEYDANKENLYAGHHNIAHNKQLIAEMKNDILFQRQKEKLGVSNGGSFSANFSDLKANNSKTAVKSSSKNNMTNQNYNSNNDKTLVISENFLCPKSVECCDIVNYHPFTDVEQEQPPIYDSAHYTDYKDAPTTLTATTTNTESVDSENQLYTKSIFCYTPHVCDTIFESLQTVKPFENDLILNVPFTAPIPPPTSTASTPRKKRRPRVNSPASSPFTQRRQNRKPLSTPESPSSRPSSPYRTLSHFGFNSPLSLPEPEHKHIPRRLFTKYIPLHKSNSYEEIFSSPRYVDLCENCFEKVVRLKPELVYIKARLRNLVDVDGCNEDVNGDAAGDATPFEFIECASSDGTAATATTTETLPAFPVQLEPVIEESSDLGSSRESNGGVGGAVNIVRIGESNISNSTFIEKISRMNYSEESVNVQFMNTIPTPTVNSHISLAIDPEEEVAETTNLSQPPVLEQQQQPAIGEVVASDDDDRARVLQSSTRYVTSVTDIWEFGNWQRELSSLDDEIDKLSAAAADDTLIADAGASASSNDSQESTTSANRGGYRRLMSRSERNQRKHEFQELWEDHIAFFDGKQQHDEHTFSDTESAIDETTRQHEHEIFHGRSYVSKILLKDSTTNTVDKVKTPSVEDDDDDDANDDEYKILAEDNVVDEVDNDDDDDSQSAHTYNISGSNEKLLFCANDDVNDIDIPAIDTIPNVIDEANTENLAPPQYVAKMQEFLLFAQNPAEDDNPKSASTALDELSDENNAADANVNDNNESTTGGEFNSLERIILEKIEVNQLKNTAVIFDKIEHTIRNKLTPSKMERMLQEQKQLLLKKDISTGQLLNCDNFVFTPNLTSSPEIMEKSSFGSFNLAKIFEEDANVIKDNDDGGLMKPIFSRSLDRWNYEDEQKRQQQRKHQLSLPPHYIDKFRTYEDLTKVFQDADDLPMQASAIHLRRSRSLTPRTNNYHQSLDLRTSPTPTAINSTTPPPPPTKKSHDYRTPSSCSMPESQKYQKSNITATPASCKRNFVLENIRNAAVPRHVKRLQGTSTNASAIFGKSPFGAAAAASSLSSAHTSNCSLNKATDSAAETSPVYAFQSKLVRGSPRFWLSMSQTTTTPKRLQTNSSGNHQKTQKRRKQQQRKSTGSKSQDKAKVSTAATTSEEQPPQRTLVDVEIDALGVEIDAVQPRLERYKRKLDDYGEVVAKCSRNMDECIQVQLDIEDEQKKLREDILLNQYVEEISCQVQTFSISETED